jgi:hypothetical protein
VATLPAAIAPSTTKHAAASQTVLIIFQSRQPRFHSNVRLDSGGYTAEFILIVAIPRKSTEQVPMLCPRQRKEFWDSRQRKFRRLASFQNY